MDRSKIGFVVGLSAEARLLRGSGFMVGIGGGTPEGAGHTAVDLVRKGAQGIISFGLSGGLNWALEPGHLIVCHSVLEGKTLYPCDAKLNHWLGGVSSGIILAGTQIAQTAADKTWLFERTKADAIDLESGAVARVAKVHNIPFAVLRAVADPAERDLPPAALIALNGAGEIGFLSVLASVLKKPTQVRALLTLATDAAKARSALVQRLKQLS